MKLIVNFGEKKVVVPCGTTGDLLVRELIRLATLKYCKLAPFNNANGSPSLNSDQVQLRLNNGAVLDPDDRVCDVLDDREELFASVDTRPGRSTRNNNNDELSSSITSSNLSTSLSDYERSLGISSSNHRHEVIVTDADLRTRSLRVKTDSSNNLQANSLHIDRTRHSPLTKTGMHNVHIDEQTGEKLFSIALPKENSPLGIHVVPFNTNDDHDEQVNGLVLQNIESDGRIRKQGILEINDRIIEINRLNIEQCSFEKAQLIFRNALQEPELELRIIRTMKKPPSSSFYLNNTQPQRPMSSVSTELNPSTKRLGKILKITLIKGSDGLGFKLASRDNPIGVANPIYVKTIFPKGAAIEDGRLRNGDRLLMVNAIDVTQMSLQEAVGLLRETRIGDTIHLCISRLHDGSLPKDLMIYDDDVKSQIITFDIPLRDTSSAGLGITLKGKTSILDGQSIDLGIFVKSILTGGAAYRDNRLRSNDQILVINDSSLVSLTNLDAANILHDAVRKEIHPGYIKITIARQCHHEQDNSSVNDGSKYVQEIDLTPALLTRTNDDNELDLTTFVPSVSRKAAMQQMKPTKLSESDSRSAANGPTTRDKTTMNERQISEDTQNGSSNPFERETPFRQSISEKRRLTSHPNRQAAHWKQQSFHDARTDSERKSRPTMTSAASIEILTLVIDPVDQRINTRFRLIEIGPSDHRLCMSIASLTLMIASTHASLSLGPADQPLLDGSNDNLASHLIRSSSFESLSRPLEDRSFANDDERKRQAKLRNRACNDSFRQAVDKSYSQNNAHQGVQNGDKASRTDKQRFKFSNLFANKSKRKENQEEKSSNHTMRSSIIHYQSSVHENHNNLYPPPPAPFSSRPDNPPGSSMANKSSKSQHNNRSSTSIVHPSSSNARTQSQGYQPYLFDGNLIVHGQDSLSFNHPSSSSVIPDYPSKTNSGKASLSIHLAKPSHPSLPREFFQANINGSQSLKQHPNVARSSYPSTFTVQAYSKAEHPAHV